MKKLCRSEKIVAAPLIFFLAIQATLSVIGYANGELLGNFMFGIIIGSALINIAVAISYFSTRRAFSTIKCLWIVFCLTIPSIGFLIVHPNATPHAEREIGLAIGYPTAVLSIPAGPLVSATISYALPNLRPNNFYLGNMYDWLTLALGGYIQWFVLLPALAHRFRRQQPV
jgi:hypothetical protein